MPKVQVVFRKSATGLTGWTVSAILGVVIDFEGLYWGHQVSYKADLVIFIADRHDADLLDVSPIRIAAKRGLTVFVVTGGEGTVSPADLGNYTGEGRVYFFHARKSTAEDGFLPFKALGPAIQRVLSGLSLDGLGKE